ncbi:MAG: glycosyltransferase [Desulfovibrio sp.]|nr:glycosyltransferase [Desulfovibrio sp.]
MFKPKPMSTSLVPKGSFSRLLYLANRLLTLPPLRKAAKRRAEVSSRGSEPILYVAASCLPYHSSGYTARTHALLRALRDASIEVRATTRPGYPWDRGDRLAEPEGLRADFSGVEYAHIKSPGKRRSVVSYALQGAEKIAAQALESGAALIHAASNHLNALPALVAARRLGLPFQYEMRGLWELSRASRDPSFRDSWPYAMGLELEKFVASEADRIFAISTSLKQYLVDNWELPPEKIEILPNCVNRDFCAAPEVAVEPDSLCYAGSLVKYEGLDSLIEAIDILRRKDRKILLNIVGDGEHRGALEELTARLGLEDRIFFRGRVDQAKARDYLARCSLVCIPRKPYEVCRLVTPLKLVEAMALGKAVVAPDLPVFREELGELGYYFQSGNSADLAGALEAVLSDREGLKERGAKLGARCLESRLWSRHIEKLRPRLSECSARL